MFSSFFYLHLRYVFITQSCYDILFLTTWTILKINLQLSGKNPKLTSTNVTSIYRHYFPESCCKSGTYCTLLSTRFAISRSLATVPTHVLAPSVITFSPKVEILSQGHEFQIVEEVNEKSLRPGCYPESDSQDALKTGK